MTETPRVHILGTSSARPMPHRDNTSLVVDCGGGLTLVDCSANPIAKLLRLGLDPLRLRRIVVTHAHPDHTYGFPAVIHGLHCFRPLRVEPLAVHAPQEALRLLLELWRAYRFGHPDRVRYSVDFQQIFLDEGRLLVDAGDYRVRTTPVVHNHREVVALRFDDGGSGKSFTYSSDTEPCPALERLAAGTDLFVMEATRLRGEALHGHSTAAEAGEVAARAGARNLLLVHVLAENESEEAELTAAAGKTFGRPVEIAREMGSYSF